jgi:hypothetical protein
LNVDYDLNLPKDAHEQDNIRVWGLPYLKITNPVPLGLLTGFGTGSLYNFFRARPIFSSKNFKTLLIIFLSLILIKHK